MSLVSVLPHMAANRFKTYGVTTKDRSPLVPDVPAMSEVQGLEGFDIAPWFGFYVPIRTPEAIQIQLQDAILTVLRDPKVRAKLEQQGVTVTPEDRKVFRARIRNELRDLEPIVKAADIKAAN
jgi:tripartite-type tricarboxylate transporter receptor subunit TctC